MKIIQPSIEIINPPGYGEMLTKIERIGRVCYKSEDKITPDSAEAFIRGIIKRGHESVIEHESITVKVICDRGVSHELVRHRLASYSQESTRYCVAGDMMLTTKNPNNKMTVAELYENAMKSRNGAWKRIMIRQFNEETKTLEYAKIKGVYKTGEKDCITIRTKLGYELTCTPEHLVMCENGYVEAGRFFIGDKIMVNGTAELYKNREWLYYQNITLNKTFKEISDEFGINVSTLKKWANRFKIPHKGTGYFHIGHTPWNKGVTDSRQADALRKYHHCGRRNEGIMKPDTVKYQKHNTGVCAVCGVNDNTEVHHMDCDHGNNDPENLITLCESCHQRVHSKNLLTAYPDEIVSIEDAGTRTVYDIEMKSESHNFVANGVIVHNCNYTGEKFDGEIAVIDLGTGFNYSPNGENDWAKHYIWQEAVEMAEFYYERMIALGATPQEARSVLPNSLKTEIVMTMDLREWRHFLHLRTSQAAHPQMQEVAWMIMEEFVRRYPVFFEDLDALA